MRNQNFGGMLDRKSGEVFRNTFGEIFLLLNISHSTLVCLVCLGCACAHKGNLPKLMLIKGELVIQTCCNLALIQLYNIC